MNIAADVLRLVGAVLLAPNDAGVNDRVRRLMHDVGDNWAQVTQLADLNLVTPALCVAFETRELFSMLPPDARQYLSAFREANRVRSTAMEAQLDEIVRTLNAVGIVPCLIKGAAHMKAGIYGDTATRMCADLDLLIPADRLLESQRALSRLGYDPGVETTADWSTHHHLPPLRRRGEYAFVELHEHPLFVTAQPCLGADEVWSEASEHTTPSLRYRLPSPTHSALLTFLHSEVVNRNLKTFFISLRSLQDIVRLVATFGDEIDWPAMVARLNSHGHGAIFRDFLYILGHLGSCWPIPQGRFSPFPTLRYAVCVLVLRHETLRAWPRRMDRLSEYDIRRRLGAESTRLAVNRERARVLAGMVRRGFQRLR